MFKELGGGVLNGLCWKFIMISTLGLASGVPRQIAYFRGKKDSKKVSGIVKTSIQIALKTISLYGTGLKNVVVI